MQQPKPHVTIIVDDEKTVYSTLDKVSGKVKIQVSVDTIWRDIDIQFVGMFKGQSITRMIVADFDVRKHQDVRRQDVHVTELTDVNLRHTSLPET